MNLQTLTSLEQSICGRHKTTAPKRRHSFYPHPKESELLKEYSRKNDITVSELVRNLIKQVVEVKQ